MPNVIINHHFKMSSKCFKKHCDISWHMTFDDISVFSIRKPCVLSWPVMNFHDMSPTNQNVSKNIVTFHDTWLLMIFRYFPSENHVFYHDLSWIFMTCHQLFQRGMPGEWQHTEWMVSWTTRVDKPSDYGYCIWDISSNSPRVTVPSQITNLHFRTLLYFTWRFLKPWSSTYFYTNIVSNLNWARLWLIVWKSCLWNNYFCVAVISTSKFIWRPLTYLQYKNKLSNMPILPISRLTFAYKSYRPLLWWQGTV